MYALPSDTIDLLDMVTRTGTGQNQQDININRISESTYITIPNKNATGRPIQVWINRQSGQENPTTITLNETLTATASTAANPRNNYIIKYSGFSSVWFY
jgi:hypothetical protein